MWYNNLLEIYKEYEKKGGNRHTLADASNLPYDTVKRVISGQTANPTLDTLDRLATAFNTVFPCSLGDIVAGTRAVVGDKTLAEVQNELTEMTALKETVEADRDFLNAENTILKEKNSTLEKEVELLKMQLAHKDELLAVHNIYLNLVKKQQG